MRGYRWLVALLVVMGAFGLAARAQAQSNGEMLPGASSVVVPANGEATVPFQVLCLDFGEPFPQTLGTPEGRADDAVVRALQVALEEDRAQTNPLALQLAIWSLREGQTTDQLYPDRDIPAEATTQAILQASAGATLSPMDPAMGVPLDQAVAAGTIEISSDDFAPAAADLAHPEDRPYYGRGTLRMRNLTGADVTVAFPLGLVFRAQNEAEQDVVAFVSGGADMEMAQQPTATAAATQAVAATAVATQAPAAPAATQAPAATAAATPGALAQTGAGDEGGSLPWLLVGVGVLVLASAGALLVRRPS